VTTKKDIVSIMACAMRNSGRTCDEYNWPEVMSEEALRSLYSAGYCVFKIEYFVEKEAAFNQIYEG